MIQMEHADSLKNTADLIYLVSCAVNGEKPDKTICDSMELTEVFESAHYHGLTVAAASALEQVVKLPEDIREEKYKAIRRLSLLNIELAQITAALENQKIWYAPVKGIVLRHSYPKTAMREMSDVDILCDSGRMDDIKTLMESLGFKCIVFGKFQHDVYEKPPQLEFEMHHSLFYQQKDAELYDYFRDIKSKLIKDSGNRYGYHMTREDSYIYQICHLRKHYRQKGIGLRSLLDIYLYNKQYGDSLDREYLQTELQKLSLIEFESKIRELSVKVFTRKELSQEEQEELLFFTESGTHGTIKHYMDRQLQSDDSARAKRKYALQRIFPTDEYIKAYHPFVYRHKVIYPLWIAARPFKGVFKHPKFMLGEIKRLKNFHTDHD